MDTSRLEAFSDAVLAIILTITVLGIHIPEDASLAELLGILPPLLIYAWSFQTIGTYWNNHHHLLKAVGEVSTIVMWSNLILLFCLSLVPLTTEWLGVHIGEVWPTFAYCALLFTSAIAYTFLEYVIAAQQLKTIPLSKLVQYDVRELSTLGCYLLSMVCCFINLWLAYFFIVAVALMWFIPDRRLLRLTSRRS